MSRFKIFAGLAIIAVLGVVARPAESFVLINEILAAPPSGAAGDANRDGLTSTNADEFVELYNPGASAVDLSGWTLQDALKARHLFPATTTLLPDQFLVVFGGGSPRIASPWQIASTGTLSLNNTGDTVKLVTEDGQEVDQVVYGSEADKGQSLVRLSEGEKTLFILHQQMPGAAGRLFSPGDFVNPQPEKSVSQVVPEWPTLGYLFPSLLVLLRRKMGAG